MAKDRNYSFTHAVVIGGSMAGLMAAKALSAHFEKVTLLDRDAMPEGSDVRKGAPQGAHVHVLMESGRHIIEKYYPGLFSEASHNGATVIDTIHDLAWFHHGVWKPRYACDIKLILCTRPFLEWNIRLKTLDVPNIQFLSETAVENLIVSPDKKSVVGIKYFHKNNPASIQELKADLIVDAAGRGSSVPAWLSTHGFQGPEEEHIGIDLSYTTGMFQKPNSFNDEWKFIVLYPKTPLDWRAGFISCVENDLWIVSLNGYFKDVAPADLEGFLEFAKTLPRKEIFNYISKANLISDIRTHKIPTSRWRHYEKLKSFPENLVNLGDSVCAFNPIFGQGMTVAAKGVSLLDKMITERVHHSPNNLKGLSSQYRRTLPSVIKTPWLLATILDLKYSQAKGKRPLGHTLLGWYVVRLLELTSTNAKVYNEFIKLIHLKEGLWAVLKPSVSLKVIAYGIKCLLIPLEKRANTGKMPFKNQHSKG